MLKEVILLCSGEAIAGVLHPIPGPLVQERKGTPGKGTVEGHRWLGNWSISLTRMG